MFGMTTGRHLHPFTFAILVHLGGLTPRKQVPGEDKNSADHLYLSVLIKKNDSLVKALAATLIPPSSNKQI